MTEKTPTKITVRTLAYIFIAVAATLGLSMGAGYLNARLSRARHQQSTSHPVGTPPPRPDLNR